MHKVTAQKSWLTRLELVWSRSWSAEAGEEPGCDSPRIHRSSVAGCTRSEHLLLLSLFSARRWSVESSLMQRADECQQVSLRVCVKSVSTSRQISAAPRHSHKTDSRTSRDPISNHVTGNRGNRFNLPHAWGHIPVVRCGLATHLIAVSHRQHWENTVKAKTVKALLFLLTHVSFCR